MTVLGTGLLRGRSFAAVIFDMDGTLIDSTAALTRAWTQWAVEFGVGAEAFVDIFGTPTADIVRSLVPAERYAAALARIDELELTELSDIVALPGAVESLEALDGAPTAIATSAGRMLAQARLTASGIPAPAVWVTFDDVDRGKPAPDPFLKAAELLNADPRDCLVVEDAPKGLAGGRAAGCATLAVTTTNPAEKLTADAVVGTLADVTWTLADGRVRLQ